MGMKLSIALATGVAIALSFSGCANDPVVELLKSNGGFAVVRPPSDGERLGDVHRNKNLLEKSISMKDVTDSASLHAMMLSRSQQVDIPSTSGSRTFSLSVDAAYVGIAKAEFEAKGVRKYRVSVSKPVVYDSPFDSHLSATLIPMIKSRFPDVSLKNKFIVRSLLEVGGLEYEFLRDDGVKIDVSIDPQFIKNLTAKLGTEWKVTETGNLTISQPRFIGYRLARIDSDGGVRTAASPSRPLSTEPNIKLSKVPISEHEEVDLRARKHKKLR
jgi:hypothetical protein